MHAHTSAAAAAAAAAFLYFYLLNLQQLLGAWLQQQPLLHQLPAHLPLTQLQGSTSTPEHCSAYSKASGCVRGWGKGD